MKYFPHDSNSFDDEKISLLFMKFGYEGLGLFYTILEKVAKQEKPINTDVLKMQLKVGKKLEKCWNYMEQIGIISSKNHETFNKHLIEYCESMEIKRQMAAKRLSKHREKQEVTEDETRFNDDCNASNITQHNITEHKEENIITKEINIPFLDFYNAYGKKVDKEKAELKWNKLTDNERTLAFIDAPIYSSSVKEKQFQKSPLVYLNGKNWQDERSESISLIKSNDPLQLEREARRISFEQRTNGMPHLKGAPMNFHPKVSVYHVESGMYDQLK